MQGNDYKCSHPLNRRQALGLLAAFGVPPSALAQDAHVADPRSYRVVLENDQVRVLEYKSRPGLGVCGQGLHYHPAHLTVSLTGARLKKIGADGRATFPEIPPGHVFFAEAETHSAEVIGGAGTRTYIVELKGRDWRPAPADGPIRLQRQSYLHFPRSPGCASPAATRRIEWLLAGNDAIAPALSSDPKRSKR